MSDAISVDAILFEMFRIHCDICTSVSHFRHIGMIEGVPHVPDFGVDRYTTKLTIRSRSTLQKRHGFERQYA